MIRARMRSPCRIRSRCPAVQVTVDFASDMETLVGLVLVAFLIPVLLLGPGGITDWIPAVPPCLQRL